MAYSAVPTVTTGDLWTAANHNTYIRDNFAAGVPDIFTAAGDLVYGSAADTAARLPIGTEGQALKVVSGLPAWALFTMSGCLSQTSGTTSCNDTTQTAVSFSTELYDPLSWHDAGGSPGTITLPDAGVYLIYLYCKWADTTRTAVFRQQIYVAGAEYIRDYKEKNNTSSFTVATPLIAMYYNPSGTKAVTAFVTQYSGYTLALSADCFFGAVKMV